MYAHVEPIDYQLAMNWYRKAADQHDDSAQNNIGYLYEKGLGVARDYSQAACWYQLAAATGYTRAQYHLGILYDLGHGVAHDAAKARELIQAIIAQPRRLALCVWPPEAAVGAGMGGWRLSQSMSCNRWIEEDQSVLIK
jgi:TPR repeat protein